MSFAIRHDAHEEVSTRPAAISDWVWTFSRTGVATGSRSPGHELTAVCTGLLFDRPALAAQVGLAPASPDADLIRAAYQRWGADLFSRLRGSFAAGVVDRARATILVGRDQMGLQPLFYAVLPDRVLLAASTHRLSRAPGVSRALNRVALADALCRRFPDPEETYYRDIRRLPAASFLRITDREVTIERYWNPLDDRTPSATSPGEAFERFTTLQRQAVRRCLSAGRRPAIFLSGGLDSVGVAATAAEWCAAGRHEPPVALSLTFPGVSCDEEDRQRAVAAALGLPQHLMTFADASGTSPLVDQAVDFCRQLSSPILNYWRPVQVRLAMKGRMSGADTVLTGEGGDEWMMPSYYLAADLIARGRFLALRRFLRAWRLGDDASGLLWHRGFRPLAGRLLASFSPDGWDRRRARRVAAGDPEWIAPDPALRRAQRERAGQVLGRARPPRGFAAESAEQTLRGSIPQQNQEEWFAQGEMLGMRFLHPYEDVDLIDFFCRLPWELSSAGGRIRGLSRRFVAARFPALGFDRQMKIVATDYHAETMEQGRQTLTTRDLQLPWLQRLGIVDAEKARESVQQSGRLPARRAWQLACTEAWIETQMAR